MNYIEQINNFWSTTEDYNLKSADISVYFALLKYNNSLNWIKSFRCDYAVICQYSGVSKNTFYNTVYKLQDLKLIDYEKGERNVLKPKITILKLKNRKGIIKEQNEEQNEEQKGNLYKLLNNKTIKQVEREYKLVNSNLSKWIKQEKESLNPSGENCKTNKEKIDGFLKWFNYQKKVHTGKLGKFKMLTSTDKNNLFKLLEVYNHKDFEEAIPKMYASDWAKENQMFTPTHFLVNNNFIKYLNQELKKEIIGLG